MKGFSLVETMLYIVFTTTIIMTLGQVIMLAIYKTDYPQLVYALTTLREYSKSVEYSDFSVSTSSLSVSTSTGVVLFTCDAYGLRIRDVYSTSVLMSSPFQCEFGSVPESRFVYIKYSYQDTLYKYAIK
jgi:hypothetical protein